MKIREYLRTNKLLCDGAFGTCYASLSQDSMVPERANLCRPDLVGRIHDEYIKAGARLIRANTFASNTAALCASREEVRANIIKGMEIASEAASAAPHKVYVAGDIGPIPMRSGLEDKEIQEEYRLICQTMIGQNADCLVFETFSGYDSVLPVIRDIRKDSDIFIIFQFSLNQHGMTNAGLSARRIMEETAGIAEIDAIGFNCGIGPGHMQQILSGLDLNNGKLISVLPNASYPRLQQDRMVFLENMDYFAEKVVEMADAGADIVGGCCGTTPDFIKRIAGRLDTVRQEKTLTPAIRYAGVKQRRKDSSFYAGKPEGKKLLAVELAPPFHADDEKILEASRYLKTHLVDAVTFPDSPSGRTRADSVLMGVKVQEQTEVNVIPHLCCRDKNAIAMRAQVLGAYMNGIRNLLIITGDPLSTVMRQDIKSVYNFDSVGLMRILQEMNREEFAEDPVVYGGALNYNRKNLQIEIGRMRKKMEAGAAFFLTQPLFTGEDADRLKKVSESVPEARILCGIMPLVSRKNAMFIKNEMAGIHVTDEIVSRFRQEDTREEGEAVGIRMAREVIAMTEGFVSGYYFSIPFNRVYLFESIMNKLKNETKGP